MGRHRLRQEPPADEAPRITDRLRLALALGREQRANWPTMEAALASYRQRSPCPAHKPPMLMIGVMTAPSNADRRRRVRDARDLMLARHGDRFRCAVAISFVLGEPSLFTPAERALVELEQKRHDDLVMVRAHDGAAASDASHGGRAVAEKALAWFIHAVNHTQVMAP